MTTPSIDTGDRKGESNRPPIASVLLVEDNMLIALDTEDALHQAGVAEVVIASNADDALAELKRQMPNFALLDFNLGHETSERVAQALAAAGVPFCYATGYGEALDDLALRPPCGVITKPYSADDIAEALARAASA